jgi:MFS family permease
VAVHPTDNPGGGKPQNAWLMLALLATAEFLGMTLWFSATAASTSISNEFRLSPSQAAWLTMAVQGGFVAGTLISALLNLPDVLATRRLFALGCVTGAVATAALTRAHTPLQAIALRVATGAALAWVYPTGMKIAAGWFLRQRGTGLGVLVASLTVGQAFPYLLAWLAPSSSWRARLLVSASLAALGAVVVLAAVHDGPYSTPSDRFDPRAAGRLFTTRRTRLAAFGYFGHMWELYAMWSWVGVFAAASLSAGGHGSASRAGSLAAFIGIATGAIGCLAAGLTADRIGRARVAGWALRTSGGCALLSGFFFGGRPVLLYGLIAVWGLVVVADSAQFSALIADYSREYVGTALTVQTCLGYLLTMVSIRLMPALASAGGWQWVFLALVPGPILGAIAMARLRAIDGPSAVGRQ